MGNRPATLLLTAGLAAALAPAAAAQSVANGSAGPNAEETAGGVVTGLVRGHLEGGETRPLGHAVIEASAGALRRATVADSLGRYRVEGLPSGQVRLRVTHPGHETLTLIVLVSEGATAAVDLELQTRPVELPPIEVASDRRVIDDPDDPALENAAMPELEVQALEIGPGAANAGMAEAVQSLPGNEPGDPTDVLLMRGAAADLKLVLLDGVPVYTPFHVAGLLRSFEPAVLGSANLHVGGAPARYDGGLSHILELRTRDARRDRVRASGSIDLLSASAALEAPLGGRAGVIASGRSLHDFGAAALGPRPYGYRDLLVAFDAEPGRGHELRATGFWNRESVLLDFERVATDASWSNRAGSLGYGTEIGDVRLDVSAGASGYRATLPLQPSARPGEPAPPAMLAAAETERLRFVAEAAWGSPATPLRAGVSFEHIDASFGARTLNGGPSAYNRGATAAAGVFFDATRRVADGVSLRAGLRVDRFGAGAVRLAPRGALRFDVGPHAMLTVAGGRYHQPTRAPDFEVERTLFDVVETERIAAASSVELHPVATADHVVLSLDQRLGERVQLGLAGFWKRYDGLQATPRETVRSSGIDLRLMSAGDRAAAWISYGLSWFWSNVDLTGRTGEFAGRHFLSAGLSGRLAGPFHAEARVAYGAGLPYTTIPFRGGSEVADEGMAAPQTLSGTGSPPPPQPAAPLVEGLDEEFLRLDLELHALLEPTWGGHSWRVRPYVRILNALDRRDALFYTFQPWRDDSATPLAERSFLPLLGVAFSF